MNTEAFFKELSQRLYKENDLSDITWAFANSDQSFKIIFMKFFFPDFGEDGEIALEFIREFSNGDSRPDLYIKTDKQEYIIEVKIYDRSHHFEQYIKAFPNAKRGYIANYSLQKKDGFVTKTWQEFYNYLLKLDKNSGINLESLSLYLHYLKSTCSLMEIQKINLQSAHTLLSFEKLIENAIGSNPYYNFFEVYKSAKSKINNRYGSYFGLQNIENNEKIWIWVGVYFFEKKTIIYSEVNEIWCGNIYNNLKLNKSSLSHGNTYEKPFEDDDILESFTFKMKEELFSLFNNTDNIQTQEKLISEYVNEVLGFLNTCK